MDPSSGNAAPAEGRSARIALIVAAALFAMYTLFAFHPEQGRIHKIIPAVCAALMLAGLRLRPRPRLYLAQVVLPFLLAAHVAAYYLTTLTPPDATAAAKAGRPFDTRGQWEVVDDLRAGGVDATVSVQPTQLLWLRGGAFDIEGVETFPLGGISGRTTVLCNEGGAYAVYDADERGFNNPKGIWGTDPIEVALVGDSFTQGACVPHGTALADRVREAHPALVNVGMSSNGPLIELATVREYAAVKRPRIVAWVFSGNDLDDLERERRIPVLLRYLDGDFRQGIFDRQPAIDRALVEITEQHRILSPRWPSSLASLGLDRRTTPVWLQDLVMGEGHTAASAVLRLDQLNRMMTSAANALRGRTARHDYELLTRILRQAQKEVGAWGGKMVLIFMPDTRYVSKRSPPDVMEERVLGIARDLGIPALDMHARIKAEPDYAALVYHPMAHFNPAGYRIIGDAINGFLAAQR